MKRLKKNAVFFGIGGIGYAIIELLWRGRTHWSMAIAGGVCFVLFSVVAERFYLLPLIIKAVIGALCVTAVEFVFGIVFNLIFDMNVWDYSNQPFNFMGQICLSFSLAWCGLAMCFLPLADFINKKLRL